MNHLQFDAQQPSAVRPATPQKTYMKHSENSQRRPAQSLVTGMKFICTCALVAVAHPTIIAQEVAASTNAPEPVVAAWRREYGPTHDQRMQWWREARFGMFIHWGVYSVPGGIWNGTNVTPSGAEWIMNRGRISVADYQKFPAQFNPVKFNAKEWVKLAKDAGMKYIVITAKHHDGFAMYRSHASKFNIYDATPFKRDPLAELAEACRREGIKLGFYYSQAQDWNHPGGAAASSRTGQPVIDKQNHWDPAQQGSMDDYIDKIAVPQVKELLSNYGPIAVWWWDTPVGMNSERAEKLLPLLKLQPQMISNNRLDRGKATGDFETPEQKIPATGLPGKDWETCMTLNRTWGFRSTDHDWKTPEVLIRNLVDIASKGGNYLLNVGPTSEGIIPEPSVERLKTVGAWMKVNGQAIYGTTASPFENLAWGRCTKKVDGDATTLYLHVFNWPKDGKLRIPGLSSAIRSATVLATGKGLDAVSDAQGLLIDVPSETPDPVSATLVVRLRAPLKITNPTGL
jgi:alpha-L-fucosidase